MFSMFFISFIDYNTRHPILGLCAAAVVLAIPAYWDKRRAKEAGLAGFIRVSHITTFTSV